eukprot:COSAG01_NODE_9906_length_2304_cov_2.481633_1_plen_350_part_00
MRSCVVSRCWKWEICSPSRKIVHILVTKIRVMFFTFRVNEVSVSCCCAGAWCIASAPLILGHDLANEATNSKIWPIITNKAAIRVSQSFATGSTFHPGGMVKSWTPPASPPPPPPPPSPTPAPSSKMYLWGAATNATGWTVPTVGVAGQVKHVPSGQCIEGATGQGNVVTMSPCQAGNAAQSFVLESNGNLHLKQPAKMCIAVQNWEGPTVVMWGCNNGENEEIVFAGGSLCSKGDKQHAARCLNVKSTPPSGGGGHHGGGGGTMQMWAKPQPAGATAVLVINNMAPGTPNVSVTINLTAVRHGHVGASSVFDIWSQEVIGAVPAGTTTFDAPSSISSHDSLFYLFEPK